MEIIKRNLYIQGTYYGDVYQGDIFMVFNKDIINDDFVAKTKQDTKYFVVLCYSQSKFAGIVINTREYNKIFSIKISDISEYNDILHHKSYFGFNMLIEVYENDLYFPTKDIDKYISLTNNDLKTVIDKLYYIANDLISVTINKDNLIKYSIFNKSKVVFELMITKFRDFIRIHHLPQVLLFLCCIH